MDQNNGGVILTVCQTQVERAVAYKWFMIKTGKADLKRRKNTKNIKNERIRVWDEFVEYVPRSRRKLILEYNRMKQ